MSRRLLRAIRYEMEVRKSRFIAQAAPVEDEAAAQAFIEEVSVADATHNCWAWQIGDRYRFDDDGEPGGTAGRPILQAITGQDYDNTVVVVTRYFGGTKLGTGGLIRAYGGVTAEALRTAPSQPIVPLVRLSLRLPFASMDGAHRLIEEFDGSKHDEQFSSEGATLIISLPKHRREEFALRLRDLARGEARITRI